MTNKIVKEAQERYALSVDTESSMRKEMLEDVRFEAGDQWPPAIKRMRETDPDGARPCLTINMSRKHKNALLNDLRRNMPHIKVLPVDDNADIETAKVLNGLLRHIQAVSDADIAYDTAADHQVTQGMGYFRIMTEVVDEERNEQEIRISQIVNPFSVRIDCYSDHPAGADAEWAFIEEEMSRKKFEKLYPDAEIADFADRSDESTLWFPDEDTVRVAEYFCIKETTKKSMRAEGVEYTEDEYWEKYTGDASRPNPEHIERKTRKCMWYKLAGDQILDERELPCSYIPVIRVAGEERRYDNKRDFRGIIRDLRDPQRMYNYNKSAYVERVALSPKTPYIGPAEAFENHEDEWADANTANRPYLPYNQYDENGEKLDPPRRQPPTPVEVALLNAMTQDAEDMRQVSGQNQAGFGEQGNENSGKAINARRQEQDTNTFHFVDNLSRSIKHAGRIIVEMIPKVYDTRRVVRILGEDDTPDFATFDPNAPKAMVETEDLAGDIQRIYNPGLGRYDVRVVVGPSYATKAEEGAERLAEIIQAAPDLMAIAGDLLFKNMDIPGAEELSERMKAMLPPQIQQLDEAKNKGRNQALQQAEKVRQQMIAEMQPIMQELQMALDEAGQENDQLQEALDKANQQLADKQAEHAIKAEELSIKRYETDLKHQSDMAGHEADVATAYIQATGQAATHVGQESGQPQGGEVPTAQPQEAAQEQPDNTEQLDAFSQAIQAIQQMQEQQGQQIQALEARMDSGDTQRAQMAKIASGLLSGEMSDQEAAAALGGRLN